MTSCVQEKHDLPEFNICNIDEIDFGLKKPCIISIHDSINSIKNLPCKVRYRGGSSARFSKHSFTIKIDSIIKFKGLPSDNNWILNASYIDKTFIRHKVSYDIFRQFSNNNISPKCRYVNVYLDSKYNGLYILMERMDKNRLHLQISDDFCFIFKDPPVFKLPPDSSKGTIDDNYFFQKYPPIDSINYNPYLFRVQKMIFNSPDSIFSDPVIGIIKYFDLNNLIDWQILLMVTNNGDGMKKNFYLYKPSLSSPMRIAPWDYDHSFGRDGDGELNPYEMLNTKKIFLIKRLMELNAFNYKNRLKRRYHELKERGILSVENITNIINNNSNYIRPYIQANFELWPVDDQNYFDNADFNQELQYLKNWTIIHLNRLDSAITNY